MPRYYCDYCDTYLTHDSPVVRKQHNTGYKHKANVRNYYMQFEEAQTQDLIDSKIMEHLARAGAGAGQAGAPYGVRPPGMSGYPPAGVPSHGVPMGSQPLAGGMAYRPPVGLAPPPGSLRPPQGMPPPNQFSYPPRQ